MLASTICGSVYLFSTSLKEINRYYLNNPDNKCFPIKFLIINGSTFILSGLFFSYCCLQTIDYKD